MEMHKSRTTEEARKALSNFCKAVGTAGDKTVHIFTIPLDRERDADCILSDVITERDMLRTALTLITELTWDREYYAPDDSPGGAMVRIAKRALYGPYECTCSEETEPGRLCEFCLKDKEKKA
jgi:hypothetical protein